MGTIKSRHVGVFLSFLLLVLTPVAVTAWYLYTRAADQFDSTVGFAVRTEETSSAVELLGGITELSGSSSSDTDILYEFLQSQRLVADIDQQLDLRGIWSIPENDFIFAYDPEGSIEDLVDYWKDMVQIGYNTSTGLMDIRVLAFNADDAKRIAEAIVVESTEMINELSNIAREDSIRYARDELKAAEDRLKGARTALTTFRNENQIVDPESDLQIQVSTLATLQGQLAEALIEQQLLDGITRANDPRVEQVARRVRIIRNQIAEERRKLGIGDGTVEGDAFADVVGEYERLAVEREFAEQTYTSALVSFDSAQAEARRQSRYLATYIPPTLSEKAQYPKRETILALIATFLVLGWGILMLVYYSIRDRR